MEIFLGWAALFTHNNFIKTIITLKACIIITISKLKYKDNIWQFIYSPCMVLVRENYFQFCGFITLAHCRYIICLSLCSYLRCGWGEIGDRTGFSIYSREISHRPIAAGPGRLEGLNAAVKGGSQQCYYTDPVWCELTNWFWNLTKKLSFILLCKRAVQVHTQLFI